MKRSEALRIQLGTYEALIAVLTRLVEEVEEEIAVLEDGE